MTAEPAAVARRPRPWIFKDHPANGDWSGEPWQWTILGCPCDIDGGDFRSRSWDIVWQNAVMHARYCPAIGESHNSEASGVTRFGCRLHGLDCRTPWGYDAEHTDQPYPYSLDQLTERTTGPHRYAYPDHDAYLAGWALWRAIRRDGALTREERHARNAVRMAPVRARIVSWGTELGVDVTELVALTYEM